MADWQGAAHPPPHPRGLGYTNAHRVSERLLDGSRHIDDVVAFPSVDGVITVKAVYLVITFLTVQKVSFVGAGEQAALGATGHVICGN